MIIFDQVTKTFPNGDTVLENLSFSVSPGEFLIITGPSGAGKTTVGRLLIRELSPTSGTITVDKEDISQIKNKHLPTLRRKIGTVFQDYKIINDKTVYENIALSLEIAAFAADQISDKITNLLKQMGISGKEHLFPGQLSGGELQRAALARAVAAEPHILFADEPTGNLDKATSREIYNLLKKINQAGTTVIMATHDEILINLDKQHRVHLDKGKITLNDGDKAKVKDKDKDKEKKEDKKEDKKEAKDKAEEVKKGDKVEEIEKEDKMKEPSVDIDLDIDQEIKTDKKEKKSKKKKRFGII